MLLTEFSPVVHAYIRCFILNRVEKSNLQGNSWSPLEIIKKIWIRQEYWLFGPKALHHNFLSEPKIVKICQVIDAHPQIIFNSSAHSILLTRACIELGSNRFWHCSIYTNVLRGNTKLVRWLGAQEAMSDDNENCSGLISKKTQWLQQTNKFLIPLHNHWGRFRQYADNHIFWNVFWNRRLHHRKRSKHSPNIMVLRALNRYYISQCITVHLERTTNEISSLVQPHSYNFMNAKKIVVI